MKFWSKKAIFGVIFFLGVWTLFGNQPPHPPTFGKDIPKKTEFFLDTFPYLEKRSQRSLLEASQIHDTSLGFEVEFVGLSDGRKEREKEDM